MKRSRWLIPAGFCLALSGGGLAVATFRGPSDPFALVLHADAAPDRRPADVATRDAMVVSTGPILQANPAPILRSLRFAILRAHSPPQSPPTS